jgi:hypothetical protein
VNDEERDDKYDHGYIFMENAQEEEVLFNVLASFVILGAYNVEEEGIPLLKIYLENGKAAVLHKKYKKKLQINLHIRQKSSSFPDFPIHRHTHQPTIGHILRHR